MGIHRPMPAGISARMRFKSLWQVVQQSLEVDPVRTVPSDFDRNGIGRLLRHLKQMDQPLEIRQLDPAITVLIEQSERLAGLEIGIPHLESQEDAPIVEGDGSILKPVSVNGCLLYTSPSPRD